MYVIRVHKSHEGRIIVAVCDEDLFGKTFEQEGVHLDLSSDFYNGDVRDEAFVVEQLQRAHIVNLAGNHTVSLAIKEGVIDEDHVIFIDHIPHAQGMVVL